MRKLPKPNDNAKEIFLECVSTIQKQEFKERLEQCAEEIATATIDYDDKKNNNKLHTISSTDNISGIISNVEMRKLYNNKLVNKKGPCRKYYDKVIASATNGICPICGHREVSTIDHYLSKMKYPLFAVSLINLVPACKDCNFVKGEYEFINEMDVTIHPYYDEIDNEIWLNAKLNEEDNIVFTFEVLKPDEWDTLLYERVKNHFKIFELNKLYSVQAAVEFEGIKRMIINIYRRSGGEEVKNHLIECLDSYQYVDLNSWKCGMYRALVENEWFYSDWLKSHS